MRSLKSFSMAIISGVAIVGLLAACASTNSGSGNSATATVNPKATVKPLPAQFYKVIREEIQYADGVTASLTQNSYDAKGNLLLEEQLDGKKNLVLKKSVEYRDNGKQSVTTIVNSSGEVQGISVKDYDAGARVVKETLSNARNEIQSVSEYTYDPQGNLLSWLTRGQSQSVMARILYTVKGSLTTLIEVQDESGQPAKRFYQDFDPNGMITVKTEKDPAGKVLSQIKYSYVDGKLTKEEYLNGDGTLQRTVTYAYNDKDQPNQAQYFDRKGKLQETRIQDFQMFTRTEPSTK